MPLYSRVFVKQRNRQTNGEKVAGLKQTDKQTEFENYILDRLPII